MHLAASSSVAESWTFPSQSLESNVIGTVNILEAVRSHSQHTSVLLASSSEIYGRFPGEVLTDTPIVPSSPYGVGKATAKALGALYRDSYSLKVSIVVLFNHESPLRGPRFVTQQIATQAVAVLRGSAAEILLGNPTIEKDFSWAPDIVKGMISSLDLDKSSDAILGSGELTSLSQLATYALEALDLPGGLVSVDESFHRLNDSVHPVAGPGLGLAELGVKKHSPRFIMESMVVDKMRNNKDSMWFIYS
jgi:GDPmannose 4,6-dehydratase